MSAVYGIDTGDGDQVTIGLPAHTARETAQRMADERGETLYLYEVGSDDEPEAIEPASPAPELIVVYVGQREDCGCAITEDEWDQYVAIVQARVREDYPSADVEMIESHWPGHSGHGAEAWRGGDPCSDAADDVRETIQGVWDEGRFWDPAYLADPE